jgi:hypothetical protein
MQLLAIVAIAVTLVSLFVMFAIGTLTLTATMARIAVIVAVTLMMLVTAHRRKSGRFFQVNCYYTSATEGSVHHRMSAARSCILSFFAAIGIGKNPFVLYRT